MFNKIIVDNVFGINSEVALDFIATPKKKDKKDTVVEIEPNTNVDKVIGIIGPNGSGKSSIINAIVELRTFIARYEIIEKAKIKDNEMMMDFINNRLIKIRNMESLDKDSKIVLETYIPNGEIPGYYTYSLVYNNEFLNEKLEYRKKYKAKKQFVIEDYTTDKGRSDIGYKCFYKDSIIKDYEQVGKRLADKFKETLKYYETFYNYYIGNSIYQMELSDNDYTNIPDVIQYIKQNEDTIQRLLKIVDPKINGIGIEKDEEGDEVIKFKLSEKVKLDIWEISTGTRRILNLFVAIMKTMENDGLMICDEIETALHKNLVQLIIQLYLKSDRYSQLIFTTHNPEVLDKSGMRNEQKYFLNYQNGKVDIRKVSEINPRADYNFSKNYYEDVRYSPQPNQEDIDKFCEFINKKIK